MTTVHGIAETGLAVHPYAATGLVTGDCMEITRYDNANDFYQRAERFLLEYEAEHNLLLGICAGAIAHPERQEYPPYLATVETEGAMVAAVVMTPPRGPVLSRVAAPEALPLLVDDLHRTYPAIPSVLGPAGVSGTFADLWCRATGRPYRKGRTEHIYQLDTVTPVVGVLGVLRRATEADRALAVAWAIAFQREALGDDDAHTAERMIDARLEGGADSGLYIWDDGQPVSLAGYTGPTPHGIRVAPVYTPPAHRGKGYASACVAALSQLLLDGGRAHCFLFTDASNPTSNHIYQAIGYRLVCDVDEYKFL